MKKAWIIVNTYQEEYVENDDSNTTSLEKAKIFPTRAEAREYAYTGDEVVRRVLLDKQGRAYKIIPGR